MADIRLVNQIKRSPKMWPAAFKFLLARKLGHKQVQLTSDGITFEVGTEGGQGAWCAISGLEYEKELKIWLSLLKTGETVLDVGANVGTFSLRSAAKVGDSGSVIAVEAMPETALRLQRNIGLNRLKNISIIQAAAGAEAGQITLQWTGHESSASILPSGRSSGQVVPMVILDDELGKQDLSRLDWIKMDIEGAEPLALAGLKRTVEKFRPKILFENGPAGQETTAILSSWNYEVGIYNLAGQWSPNREAENLFARPLS